MSESKWTKKDFPVSWVCGEGQGVRGLNDLKLVILPLQTHTHHTNCFICVGKIPTSLLILFTNLKGQRAENTGRGTGPPWPRWVFFLVGGFVQRAQTSCLPMSMPGLPQDREVEEDKMTLTGYAGKSHKCALKCQQSGKSP